MSQICHKFIYKKKVTSTIPLGTIFKKINIQISPNQSKLLKIKSFKTSFILRAILSPFLKALKKRGQAPFITFYLF